MANCGSTAERCNNGEDEDDKSESHRGRPAGRGWKDDWDPKKDNFPVMLSLLTVISLYLWTYLTKIKPLRTIFVMLVMMR
jgi:hypothetical protein